MLWNPNILGSRPTWDIDVSAFFNSVTNPSGDHFSHVAGYPAPGVYVGPADHSTSTPFTYPDDPDGDGLARNHDDCPSVFDPDQIDSDADGVGDACDNCPGLYNPASTRGAQANCNLDSELAVRAHEASTPQQSCTTTADCTMIVHQVCVGGSCATPIRGDACDPNPCGLTMESDTTAVSTPLSLSFTNGIVVDGRVALPDDPARRGSTGFRFCTCDLARVDTVQARTACADLSRPLSERCTLNAVQTYADTLNVLSVSEGTNWRWLTTRDNAVPPPVLFPVDRYALAYRAFGPGSDDALVPTGFYTLHLHDLDVPRWLMPGSPLSTSYPTTIAEAEHVRGVGWTHTASLGDPTRDEMLVACGDGLTACTSDARCIGTLGCVFPPGGLRADLSSNYWSGSIDASTAIALPSYVPCLGPIGTFSNDAACPACGHFFPELAICVDTPSIGLLLGNFALPTTAFQIPTFDPATFAPAGLRWVAASEPTGWRQPTGLRYISLHATTNLPISLVFATSSGLSAASACGKQSCGPALVGPPALRAATVATPNGVPVLSSTRDTLFVIGADGASQIDAFSVSSQSWSRLPAGSRLLGRVLAATYSAEDDSLYVIDELSDPHGDASDELHGEERDERDDADRSRSTRLVRVDPVLGTATVMRHWRPATTHARFTLTAGTAHRLYVAASHGTARHVLVALDTNGTLRAITHGHGGLTGAPIHASERGLTLVVSDRHGVRAIGYEWSRLRPSADIEDEDMF